MSMLLSTLRLGDLWRQVLSFTSPPDWLRFSNADARSLQDYYREFPRLLVESRPIPIWSCIRFGNFCDLWVHSKRNPRMMETLLEEGIANPLLIPATLSWPANLAVARILLQSRADVNEIDEDGVAPIHEAAGFSTVELTKLLIVYRSDVNGSDSRGSRPLHYASQTGQANTVALLLEAKATDLDAQCNFTNRKHNGATALMLAAERNRVHVVRMLIDAGARGVNVCKANGVSAMTVAASKNLLDVLSILLEVNDEFLIEVRKEDSGAHTGNQRFQPHASPMMAAIQSGHVSSTKLLIEARACVSSPCLDGDYPILECARAGNAELLQVLIDARAAVSSVFRNHRAFTPLYVASSAGH
eukprot:5732397-Pyramimonas_sp.AAC.3